MEQGRFGEQGRWGVFYGVGVGPGDPELVTLKAARVVGRVPIICVPISRKGADSYVLGIVSSTLDLENQRVVELLFPMTKDASVRERHRNAAVETVVSFLRDGQDVAFLTEGDPFIYSTFMDLYQLLRERHPGVEVQVIPGVSSINASAAVAGFPLVDGGERLAVLPATYESGAIEKVLAEFDTVVFLKVNRVFDRLLDLLERHDLLRDAVYVRRCGSPEQEVIREVGSLRGQELDYLSLLIVRVKHG